MTKRYNSVTLVTFEVHHDDKDAPTADEYWNGLLRRFGDLLDVRERNYEGAFDIFTDLIDTVDTIEEEGAL